MASIVTDNDNVEFVVIQLEGKEKETSETQISCPMLDNGDRIGIVNAAPQLVRNSARYGIHHNTRVATSPQPPRLFTTKDELSGVMMTRHVGMVFTH